MENERLYELRSRSRSGTPLVQSRALIEPEISERRYDLRSRSRERSPGEVTLSGNDPESTTERSATKLERRSERQKARRQIHANGRTADGKVATTLTSDYSSEEGEDLSTNRPSSAHEIYKQAGDWWNVFPKTDYTYSERSRCRYEIAPGILAMPNMSRRSIHSDLNRLSDSGICSGETTSVEKEKGGENSTQIDDVDDDGSRMERYRCRREVTVSETWTNSRSKCIDSDAEIEEAVSNDRNGNGVVVSRFGKLWKFLNLERRESKRLKVWRSVDRSLQYVYFFMVKVFFFDSWLLSRISGVRRWFHRRSPNVVWLAALLPLLLLLTGTCIVRKQSFIRLDSLHSIPYDVTETSNRIFNDIISLTSLRNNDLFVEYVKTLKNLSVYFLPGANVSLPEMMPPPLSIGCWCLLPCLSTLLLPVEVVVTRQNDAGLLFLKKETMENGDPENFDARKPNSLEDRTNQILLLEEGLKYMYSREIDRIESQFEALKELCSKSCCDTDTTKYVTSEDLEKRIETVLTNYFVATVTPKKEEIEVEDDDDRVREIVKEALKVYDADKTGRVDYALEPAGGQIISTRCTQIYDIRTRAFKLLTFTLYHENNNPRTVIQGNPIQPGACWAFQGFPGYLLIKLRNSIYVTGFTVEHAPKSILPNGEMKSAPKKFNVWGFVDENDPEPVMFGDYEFAASADSLQYFPVLNTTIEAPYEYVELRVHSNHGQLEYTCLYRFRVHGKPF